MIYAVVYSYNQKRDPDCVYLDSVNLISANLFRNMHHVTLHCN